MSLLWRNFDRDDDRADLRSLPPAGPSQPVAILTVTESGEKAASHYLTADAVRTLRHALSTLLVDPADPAHAAVGGVDEHLAAIRRIRDRARELASELAVDHSGPHPALARLAALIGDLALMIGGPE